MKEWFSVFPWLPIPWKKSSASLFFSTLLTSPVAVFTLSWACFSATTQHTKLTPLSVIQILYITLAPLPGCLPAPQQVAPTGHRPWRSTQSRGTLPSLPAQPAFLQQAAPSAESAKAGERGCKVCPPIRATSYMYKHFSGWGCLQCQGFHPHTQQAGHLFVHSP